jgi:hypothetical protein
VVLIELSEDSIMLFTVIDFICAVSAMPIWIMILWLCSKVVCPLSPSHNNEETHAFELDDMSRQPIPDNFEHNREVFNNEEAQEFRLDEMSRPLILDNPVL